MGLRIHTNTLSITAQRHLRNTVADLQVRFRRLASGLRIERASDDPGGLGIAERLRAQHRSAAAAARGVQDGISLVQTAEGALQEFSNLLVRSRELVVSAGNGALNPGDLQLVQTEYLEVARELFRIAESTEFNDIRLFDDGEALAIVTGIDGDTVDVNLRDLGFVGNLMWRLTQIPGLGLDTPPGRRIAARLLDFSIDYVNEFRGHLGATQNRLESAYRTLLSQSEHLASAESRIRDADIAIETAALTRALILQQAGLAVLARANVQPELALRLLA